MCLLPYSFTMIACPLEGFATTKAGKKVPVTVRALTQRINRTLREKNQRLKLPRGAQARLDLGGIGYYVIDCRRNRIVADHVDIEVLGRKLGALREWEEVRS
jgi:hypothetical protein